MTALILPLAAHADGQGFLSDISDAFDFIVVFSAWALLVFPAIFFINLSRAKKLSATFKTILLVISSLLALFVWLVKYDPEPFDGPIDSIWHRKQNEAHRKADSINLHEGYSDSTIEEKIAAADTGTLGIYIWLHHKKVFVRKHGFKFGSQRQEDSLTMDVVHKGNKIEC